MKVGIIKETTDPTGAIPSLSCPGFGFNGDPTYGTIYVTLADSVTFYVSIDTQGTGGSPPDVGVMAHFFIYTPDANGFYQSGPWKFIQVPTTASTYALSAAPVTFPSGGLYHFYFWSGATVADYTENQNSPAPTRASCDAPKDLFNVAVGDFAVSTSPSSMTVYRGNTGTFTVTISSLYGGSDTVNLGVSGLPASVTASLSVNPVVVYSGKSATSMLTISVGSKATLGTYSIKITGTGFLGQVHSATLTLTISSPPPPPQRCPPVCPT